MAAFRAPRRTSGRVGLGVVAVVVAVATACSSTTNSAGGAGSTAANGATDTGTGSAAASIAPLGGTGQPWLHIEHPTDGRLPFIADESGRFVLLRGVNTEGLEDEDWRSNRAAPNMYYPTDPASYAGKCPSNSNEVAAPLCEVDAGKPPYEQSTADTSHNDLAQMRQLGFDMVRLTLSWSQLEPTPGNYDTPYLQQVAEVVQWAKEQGIYVLLDMHQDQYSRFIMKAPTDDCTLGGGVDGAPAWAVQTDGKSACSPLGQSVLNAAMGAAFNHFWQNSPANVAQGAAPGPGLQDHWIGAMAALARKFKDEPTVAGYEIMNEPAPGTFNAFDVSDNYLFPFYRRTIEALTGERDGLPECAKDNPSGPVPPTGKDAPAGAVPCAYPDLGIRDTRHLVFAEPIAYRNLVDFSPQTSKSFTHYPNVVLEPHTYGHVFTVDSFIGYKPADSPYPPTLDFAYATATWEAKQMNMAVFDGEFGNGPEDDDTLLAPNFEAQERWQIGSTVWTWKGNCSLDPSAKCDPGWPLWNYGGPPGTGPIEQNGPIQTRKGELNQRVYPRAVVGSITYRRYDPATKTFVMEATAPAGEPTVAKGDRTHETVIFIPRGVSGDVTVTGGQLDEVVTNPDGTRTAFVIPAGTYQVSVGGTDQVPALTTKVKAEPKQDPIDTLSAEATFKAFLDQAQQSPDPKIASQAKLVAAIANTVLAGAPTS